MSVRFLETQEPPTPPAGRYWLYVDVADARLKGKDDAGNITTFETNTELDREVFLLTVEDAANKSITLSYEPADGSNIIFNPIGGPTQVQGLDYDVVGNVISWNGLALDGILEAGDRLVIYYQRKST